VLITGAAGSIGSRLAQELGTDYDIAGIDMPGKEAPYDLVGIDLTTNASVQQAFHDIRDRKGTRLAAVIHLAAYFDFSGEPSPLYEAVNEAGTRRLLDALQAFEVERFIYASTMLVHAPCEPGELINEESELAPGWAYPESKLRTEKIIAESHGRIPYLLLRLAGLYDDSTAVPTLSHQIARIYERNIKSRLYSGDPATGQAFIHLDDLVDLFSDGLGGGFWE
jgi:nucleoside-diphosphate-sugar epimerase